MTTKQFAFAISRTFIRGIQCLHPATSFESEKKYMQHQNYLNDGTHLHTFETYEARPYVQERMGMNCTVTAVGFPFVEYGHCVRVYMWGDWVRRPVWYLQGMNTATVRNLTLDKRIHRTGVVFFTIAELDGVRRAQ